MSKPAHPPVLPDIDPARLSDLVAATERVFRDLPAAELAVLRSRFGLGLRRRTQREIARTLNISIGSVRRLERRALRILRALSLPVDLPRCRTASRGVFPPRRLIGPATPRAARTVGEPAQLASR